MLIVNQTGKYHDVYAALKHNPGFYPSHEPNPGSSGTVLLEQMRQAIADTDDTSSQRGQQTTQPFYHQG